MISLNCCDKSWKEVCGDCNNPPISDWTSHAQSAPDDPVLGHHDVLPGGVTCSQVIERWQQWIFETPNLQNPVRQRPGDIYTPSGRSSRPELIGVNKIYMTAFAPFFTKQDNVQTLVIKEKANSYVLLPILTSEAGSQEYPTLSSDSECFDLCVKDTNTTRRLELCIDGIPRVGCYEERRNFLRIFGVPNENHMNIPDDRTIKPGNAIDIVYNGYWGLIDVNRLVKGTGTGAIHGTGDHLITFEGEGATYFVAGTLNITVLD